MQYPEEWNELPKKDRKKKIKELKRKKVKQEAVFNKARNIIIAVVAVAIVVIGYRFIIRKSPEETALEQKISEVSLEGMVEEFEIEGANHINPGETASYNTNPPTSGAHWATPADWKFNNGELTDEQLVHNLEHGGIWISYKDLDEGQKDKLKNIAKKNSSSVVITRRDSNEDLVVVVSWGRMMKLTRVDEAVIQKYIDTYINQSPEKLAR